VRLHAEYVDHELDCIASAPLRDLRGAQRFVGGLR
jgi:hypothetical protein